MKREKAPGLFYMFYEKEKHMKITTVKIEGFTLQYPIELLGNPKEILFLDIETTGFTAHNSKLYMIGCAFYEDDGWYIRQYFAEKYDEEVLIIKEFYAFMSCFKQIVHFNGNNFDIPYLQQKSDLLELDFDFRRFEGIDIYKRIAPFKEFLNLPNCKQTTLERFIGIDRLDTYSGGELISVYRSYVKEPSEDVLLLLFLHNADDVKGMLRLLPILAYYDLFALPMTAKKVQTGAYKSMDGELSQELLIKLALPTKLPAPIVFLSQGCYFKAEGENALLKVPLYEEELKYFYTNYKDYYYLPNEDLALHKSVGSFVEKEYRTQAKASNCYTRKYSQYLRQWGDFILPVFKRDYDDADFFFELTDERKKDRDLFSLYACHVLSMLANC